MPVRQNQSKLSIDDESGCLTGLIPLSIESTRTIDANRHDSTRYSLERSGPFSLLSVDLETDQQPGEQRQASFLLH